MGASAQAAPTETRSDENTLRAVVRAGLEAAAWQRHGRGGAGKPAVARRSLAKVLATLRRVLDLIEACKVDGDPQAVFAAIEEDVRARMAVPVESK
jgi:hypothetical protein